MDIKLNVPAHLRKGTLKKDQIAAIHSAMNGFNFIQESTNMLNLESINLLDYGCGVKYTQAFIQNNVNIKSYTGVDVDNKMIKYLKNNVTNEKYKYSQLPFYNEMYNKVGVPMKKDADLKIGDNKYNLITALSVFTHLVPRDSRIVLKVMKRYLSEHGKIFFTTFINDKLQKQFKDIHPDKPLLRAVYKTSFWEKAIKEADLKIVAIQEKNEVFTTKKQYILSN